MKKLLVLSVLGVILMGCVAERKPQKSKVIYLAPPPPKTYNLNVFPGDQYLFEMGGREYTYNSMRIYINTHKRETKGLYSVLMHLENIKDKSKKLNETACFGILMMDTGVAGYWDDNGGASPVRWENSAGGSLAIRMMYRQCSRQ